MRNSSIVYYVSGHGYGHARRAAEVMGELTRRSDKLAIHVRTSAPAWLFDRPGARVMHHAADIDPGCVEADLLSIDAQRTAERVGEFIGRGEEIVEAEAEAIRDHGADLIVADIPFLAGDIAKKAGLPCIAISNFTWDWIYEQLFEGQRDAEETIARIRASYGEMKALLRIPWGGVAETFPRIVDCPLIASVTRRSAEDVLRDAGIDREDSRPRILIAIRGGIDDSVLHRVARESSECLFLQLGALGGRASRRAAARQEPRPPADTPRMGASLDTANLRRIPPADDLDFSELLSISDAVVSKVGYGIIADCIAGKKRLLWPRRVGFREDALSETEAKRFIPMREIGVDDFRAGRWSEHLKHLLAAPMPIKLARTDGAAVCAEHLLGALIGRGMIAHDPSNHFWRIA